MRDNKDESTQLDFEGSSMGLPSIYANDEDKVLTNESFKGGSQIKPSKFRKRSGYKSANGKYKVIDIENIALSHSGEANTDDVDSPMSEMQLEDNSQLISSPLSQRRRSNPECTKPYILKEVQEFEISKMIPTKIETIFVTDTNFLISHLSILEALRQLASSFHHQVVVPNTAVRELDGLKNSSKMVQVDDNSQVIGLLARRANDWIYRHLANLNSGVIGQKIRQTINPNCVKDDAILDCCLFFKERLNCFVILLSNDKNLCMKALTENLLTISFRKGMTARLIASMTYNENISLYGPGTGLDEPMVGTEEQRTLSFTHVSIRIYTEITATTTEAVHHILVSEYGEDIDLLSFQLETLHDLSTVARCIDRFWVSVFAEYFKKSTINRSDWERIPASLINSPVDSISLKNFVKFWEETLDILYLKRNQSDTDRLNSSIQQWTELIHDYD